MRIQTEHDPADILDKVHAGIRLTFDDCLFLLQIPEQSPASAKIRAEADTLLRKKHDNAAIVIGQIGIDVHPCEANCRFCSFGGSHSAISQMRADDAAIIHALNGFAREGDLYGVYLMTMADTDREYLLHAVETARSAAPAETQIWVNTGDNERAFFEELRDAGAAGAYHVCRLREGVDTAIDPRIRIRTMQNIREADMQLFSCCEPIGPEHSDWELAENIMLCTELEVTQYGAMRRTAVHGSPLAENGQISNLRLAHILGVVGLMYASAKSLQFMGVHEPCELGYLSGANFITAETGANPRDTVQDTAQGRGWDMARCRRLLYDCGFTALLCGNGSRIALNYDYLTKTEPINLGYDQTVSDHRLPRRRENHLFEKRPSADG